LKFRTLVAPVIIAVALSITALVTLVIFAASEQDEQALESEKAILQQEISSHFDRLRTLTEDNAWWDTSVEKVILVEDLPWIENSFGASAEELPFVDGTILVRPDFSILYSYHDKLSQHPFINDQNILNAKMVRVLRSMNIAENDSVSGAAIVGNQLIAFAATLFESNDDNTFVPTLPDKRPILIFYSILTDFKIEQLGTSNALNSLTFSTIKPDLAGRLALNDMEGSLLGWFSWRTRAPGTDMALDLVWPSLLLVLLVFAAMVRFIRQASKIVEGQEQANRAKTSFLASMSHEVRTPLNSILGFAELLSLEMFGKIEGEKNKEYLQLIRNSGEHLLTIINDILDISKLEAGKFDVYAEKVHPNDIIDDSIRMVEPSAEERGVTITKHREKASIYSDERIIRQVLINILSNAIKFTPNGGAVHVEASRAEDDYQILITDNGIGMSETEIEIALSTFGQVRNGLAKRHGGTGLGLPLVARFMKLLGGNIEITSNPGKGTSVTLFLPYKVDPE